MPKQFLLYWRGEFEEFDTEASVEAFVASAQRQLQPGTHVELYRFSGCYVIPELRQMPFVSANDHDD